MDGTRDQDERELTPKEVDALAGESLEERQAAHEPKPEFLDFSFRPEYSDFEKFLFATSAYVKANEDFRKRVRAVMNVRGYQTEYEAYAQDDGTLEARWSSMRRLSAGAEQLFRKMVKA